MKIINMKKTQSIFDQKNIERPIRGELYKLEFKNIQGYFLSPKHNGTVIRLRRRLKNTRYFYKAMVMIPCAKDLTIGQIIKLNVHPNNIIMTKL